MTSKKMKKQIQRFLRAERACLTAISVCFSLCRTRGQSSAAVVTLSNEDIPLLCVMLDSSGRLLNLVDGFSLLENKSVHLKKSRREK